MELALRPAEPQLHGVGSAQFALELLERCMGAVDLDLAVPNHIRHGDVLRMCVRPAVGGVQRDARLAPLSLQGAADRGSTSGKKPRPPTAPARTAWRLTLAASGAELVLTHESLARRSGMRRLCQRIEGRDVNQARGSSGAREDVQAALA